MKGLRQVALLLIVVAVLTLLVQGVVMVFNLSSNLVTVIAIAVVFAIIGNAIYINEFKNKKNKTNK